MFQFWNSALPLLCLGAFFSVFSLHVCMHGGRDAVGLMNIYILKKEKKRSLQLLVFLVPVCFQPQCYTVKQRRSPTKGQRLLLCDAADVLRSTWLGVWFEA